LLLFLPLLKEAAWARNREPIRRKVADPPGKLSSLKIAI
jgi:hypothetical protein